MQNKIIALLFLLVSLVYAQEKNNLAITVKTTLDKSLQSKLQPLAKSIKNRFKTKGVYIAVMDSKSGNILGLADSNSDVLKDFPNSSIANFTYEPGFVFAPIVFSLALDKHLVNPDALINAHKGKYKVKGMTVVDRYPHGYLSASSVLVYSSNIGMVQIAQKVSAKDYYDGLISFGLNKRAVDWLANEKSGLIPTQDRLKSDIYKATTSYGYGVRVNLFQLLQAYNVFNNDGLLIKPKIFANIKPTSAPQTVLDAKTAHMMKKILIETVQKGTGKNAKIDGLEIGGKTGTAHVVENGRYVKKYNHSFVGFVNGDNKSYTIAVLVQEPKTSEYALQTAAVVFRKVVEALKR